MEQYIEELQHHMKKRLKHSRYMHSVGVMYTAMNLAMRYNVSMYDAGVAGILHDCAKEMNNEELIKYSRDKKIKLTPDELSNTSLIHSKAGAYMAAHRYGIKDNNIINSISYHTTGRPGMTRLEQIIYIADYIEPGRKPVPGLDEARKNVYIDIDYTCMLILGNTIDYIQSEGKTVDHTSIEAYKYYTDIVE